MPHADMQDVSQQTPSDSPVPHSQEPTKEIHIAILPDGFTIDGEPVPDLSSLLKTIIAIVREHPATGDAQDELKAGYESA